MNTETRIFNILIRSTLCYADETWKMSKVEMALGAFERKILKNIIWANTGECTVENPLK
jgi:hypothetical protein